MKTYARVENRLIAEIIKTALDIHTLFHPSLQWVDVSGKTVQVGWLQGNDGTFAAPPSAEPPSSSVAGLLAEISALQSQVAQLHVG
jgi:hypothetical protein